jgi:hypothetical protein
MTVTGHKTRDVFRRYNITVAEDVRNALQALAGTKHGQTKTTGRVRPFARGQESRKV